MRPLAFLFAVFFAAAGALRSNSSQPGNLDLFLLIGQSNMAGRGKVEAADREPLPGIWSLDAQGAWVPAVDPLHSDKPIAGVGMGRTFARTVRAVHPAMEIGLIPSAFGGTSLDQWKPGGELFTNAVRRARLAMERGRLRGILWHQGESDSRSLEKADTYADRWMAMITELRRELNAPDVPVVLGGMGDFLVARQERYPGVSRLNVVLASLGSRERGIAFVDVFGLEHMGDDLHFSSRALREMGVRYAQAWMRLATSPAPSRQ